MKYKEIEKLEEEKFRRLTGVKREHLSEWWKFWMRRIKEKKPRNPSYGLRNRQKYN